MFYAIKMLYSIEQLHQARVLHGDVKPDNWLITPGGCDWVFPYARTSEPDSGTYRAGDLRLIDFGRSIDLSHYSDETAFVGDCHAKGFQCVEMLSNRPWTYQIDSFGFCGSVHCMLFGEYMEISSQNSRGGSERWHIRKTFKRYWQVNMWEDIFDELLNVKSCSEQPSLALVRRRLESYFADNLHHQQVRSMKQKIGSDV